MSDAGTHRNKQSVRFGKLKKTTQCKAERDKLRTYDIVAPGNDREKVVEEANRQQFLFLDARCFSLSSVEELYYICTHRSLHGGTQEFLDCYMEKVCVN